MRPRHVLLPLAVLAAAPAHAQEAAPAAAQPVDTSKWPKFIPNADVAGRDLSQYGYVRKRKLNNGLIAAGASVFGATYLTSTFVGALATDIEGTNDAVWMFVPVVGPIGWAATDGGSGFGNYILGVDALAQAAGITLLTIGLVGQDGWERKSPALLMLPTASHNQVGLTAVGTF